MKRKEASKVMCFLIILLWFPTSKDILQALKQHNICKQKTKMCSVIYIPQRFKGTLRTPITEISE